LPQPFAIFKPSSIFNEVSKANFSRTLVLFFVTWLNPLLRIGKTRALVEEDLYSLPTFLTAEILQRNWEPYWKRTKSLHRVVFDALIMQIIIVGIIELLTTAIDFWALPFLVGQFVMYIDSSEKTNPNLLFNSYTIAMIIIGVQILRSVLNSSAMMVDRASICIAENTLKVGVYQKIFKLSPKSRAIFFGSKLINNISVDCNIFAYGVLAVNDVWIIVLRVIIGIFFLVRILGVAVWPSFSLIVMAAAITISSGTLMGPKFQSFMTSSDDRIKAITEAVKGMKIIKYFALEDSIEKGILKFRDYQINALRSLLTIIVLSVTISGLAPLLMPVIAYALYASQNTLTASVVFSSLLVFKNLTRPLSAAGGKMQAISAAKNSWERLFNYSRLKNKLKLIPSKMLVKIA
jgi:ATP-binding cassette, subfamily C (CFTR/MRP), member 1